MRLLPLLLVSLALVSCGDRNIDSERYWTIQESPCEDFDESCNEEEGFPYQLDVTSNAFTPGNEGSFDLNIHSFTSTSRAVFELSYRVDLINFTLKDKSGKNLGSLSCLDETIRIRVDQCESFLIRITDEKIVNVLEEPGDFDALEIEMRYLGNWEAYIGSVIDPEYAHYVGRLRVLDYEMRFLSGRLTVTDLRIFQDFEGRNHDGYFERYLINHWNETTNREEHEITQSFPLRSGDRKFNSLRNDQGFSPHFREEFHSRFSSVSVPGYFRPINFIAGETFRVQPMFLVPVLPDSE